MPSSGRNALTAARRIRAALKVERAFRLKIGGASNAVIAEACGWKNARVAATAVRRQVVRLNGQNEDQAKDLRDVQNARLEEAVALIQDDLHCVGLEEAESILKEAKSFPQKLRALEVVQSLRMGRYRAIHTLIDLMKRQAALFGLDAAKKTEIEAAVTLAQELAIGFQDLEEEDDAPRTAAYTVQPAGVAGVLGEKGVDDGGPGDEDHGDDS